MGGLAQFFAELAAQVSGYTNPTAAALLFGLAILSLVLFVASQVLKLYRSLHTQAAVPSGAWQWHFERDHDGFHFRPESRWPYTRLISLRDAAALTYPKIHQHSAVMVLFALDEKDPTKSLD